MTNGEIYFVSLTNVTDFMLHFVGTNSNIDSSMHSVNTAYVRDK